MQLSRWWPSSIFFQRLDMRLWINKIFLEDLFFCCLSHEFLMQLQLESLIFRPNFRDWLRLRWLRDKDVSLLTFTLCFHFHDIQGCFSRSWWSCPTRRQLHLMIIRVHVIWRWRTRDSRRNGFRFRDRVSPDDRDINGWWTQRNGRRRLFMHLFVFIVINVNVFIIILIILSVRTRISTRNERRFPSIVPFETKGWIRSIHVIQIRDCIRLTGSSLPMSP